jgi:hypothetical protein
MDQMIDKPGKAGTVIPAIGVMVIPIKTGLAALTLWMLLERITVMNHTAHPYSSFWVCFIMKNGSRAANPFFKGDQ